jgi:phage recombination protein Bet
MSQIVRLQDRQRGLSRKDKVALQIFRKGAGKELTAEEFDEALYWCEHLGASPITNDIFFFVFKKKDRSGNVIERTLTPVVSRNHLRKIANRTGDYRADDAPARFRYDQALKGPSNPRGIVDCEVTVYKYLHGEWHPITERVRWDERAPLVTERWEGAQGQRRKVALDQPILDPSKPNWAKMPETMIAKCTEAAALRKGWPEEMSGTYGEGELDRADTEQNYLDLTATEVFETAEADDRKAKVGGGLVVDWCDGEPLDMVEDGQFADKVMAFVERCRKNDDGNRIRLFP